MTRSPGRDGALDRIFPGDGEMARRMRAFDWSRTALGAVETWPQSLRHAVAALLVSKAQIILVWGDDLTVLYNDAYHPVFGAKHPGALGMPVREAWSEIWRGGLEDLFDGVLTTGEAFWAQDRPFFIERYGYLEETYFDVSYDPVRDESGRVRGVYCIVTETTERVVGERRLTTLRDLGRITQEATGVAEVYRAAAGVLRDSADIPFALLYGVASPDAPATLVASTGIDAASPAVAGALGTDARPAWPRVEALTVLEGDALTPFGALHAGPWPEPIRQVAVVPLALSGQPNQGFLVAGISPRRRVDAESEAFLGVIASSIAGAAATVRRTEEERHRAEALAELDRAKTAFFSNVSHEFRTPLTLMLGPLEDALAAALPDGQRERLEVAHRNSYRLLRLVNTLLDFSRIEAGRAEAAFEAVDVATLTADLASVFRSAVERAGLSFGVRCETPRRPVFVDRDMWEKVVLNLLSNAFKFTLEGGIEVSLVDRGDAVELAVEDTGVGIPQADLGRVFERFHRVRGTEGRTHEGTGIGLALVSELVKLHGGEVAVTSRLGEGARFTVRIPTGSAHLPPDRIGARRTRPSTALGAAPFVEEALRWLPEGDAPPATPLPDPIATAATYVTTAGARVLVADDNADMRAYLERLLSAHWTVEAVADGEAALQAALRKHPDVVLSDVMMPRRDGIGLIRALRGDPALTSIPVILLSARSGEEARVEGLNAGADDYLTKPFTARELVARVNANITLARVRREALRELRQAEEAARAAQKEAEDANRAKDEFLATVSHELRSPLQGILGWLSLLKLGRLDDAQHARALDSVERSVRLQAQLVHDIMDVSRIVAGKVELERTPVDVTAIVASTVDEFMPGAVAKGIELSVAGGPCGIVLGDRERLHQVFANLLSNALKFTPPGGRVTVTCARDGRHCVVTAADTGLGIKPEFLPRLFERFMQADTSSTRRYGGLGLGLAIVKQLVELHGGTVTATSAGLGRGASFEVRLGEELAAERAERVSIRPPVASAPRLDGVEILLVEDDRDALDAMTLVLEGAGATVRPATSVREAWAVLRRQAPHVVVSDLSMPEEDGYTLLRRIRAAAITGVPAIALTGFTRPEDRNRVLSAGFAAHVPKPVEPDVLIGVLTDVLARGRLGAPLH